VGAAGAAGCGDGAGIGCCGTGGWLGGCIACMAWSLCSMLGSVFGFAICMLLDMLGYALTVLFQQGHNLPYGIA
jgi:hypothetical protein